MKKIIRILCFAMIALAIASCDRSEQDFEQAKCTNTISSYEAFLQKHPNVELSNEARDSIVAFYSRESIKAIPSTHQDKKVEERLNKIINHLADSLYKVAETENTVFSWQSYLYAVPQEYARDSYERRNTLVDEAYRKAEKANTIVGWKTFLNEVPMIHARDANERIRELEEQAAWSTETKAWQTASSRGTSIALQKYLELYPKGAHARQVEKKLIDIEVTSVFAGEHSILPQMDRGYSTGASYSIIEIENRTQYELTVSYSGPDSKRMVISPYATKSMRIGNGNYRVAASVGHGVRPFAGSEYLDGSHFSSSFYIQTTRY